MFATFNEHARQLQNPLACTINPRQHTTPHKGSCFTHPMRAKPSTSVRFRVYIWTCVDICVCDEPQLYESALRNHQCVHLRQEDKGALKDLRRWGCGKDLYRTSSICGRRHLICNKYMKAAGELGRGLFERLRTVFSNKYVIFVHETVQVFLKECYTGGS